MGAAEIEYFFGNPGDKPFVGDFDGDGKETIGLHRESTGLVYFRNSHTQGVADLEFIFGDPGDRLIAGDWTGDGTDTPAVFRPGDTTFYFRYSNTQGTADDQFSWGVGSGRSARRQPDPCASPPVSTVTRRPAEERSSCCSRNGSTADRWEALIRPARRIRAGQELRFGDIKGHVLTDPDRGVVTVALEAGKTDVDDALGVDGEVPLPPYFRGSLATPDRYQTMFAKAVGSAAAPTAGLHFTPSLAEDLRERGFGSPRSISRWGSIPSGRNRSSPIADHRMHREAVGPVAATFVTFTSPVRRWASAS